jgi:hypothetical protein
VYHSGYANVSVVVSCSYDSSTGTRSPEAAIQLVVDSLPSVRQCCNVTYAALPGELVEISAVLTAISTFEGTDATGGGSSSQDAANQIWIFIGIAVIVVGLTAGTILYRRNVGSTFSGRNRHRREEPEVSLKRLVLAELETGFVSPSSSPHLQHNKRSGLDEFGSSSAVGGAASLNQNSPATNGRRVVGGGGSAFSALSQSMNDGRAEPSLADPRVADQEIDVDEELYAAQPPHVFGRPSSQKAKKAQKMLKEHHPQQQQRGHRSFSSSQFVDDNYEEEDDDDDTEEDPLESSNARLLEDGGNSRSKRRNRRRRDGPGEAAVAQALREQQEEFLQDPVRAVTVYPSTMDGTYSVAEHYKKFRPMRKPAADILL